MHQAHWVFLNIFQKFQNLMRFRGYKMIANNVFQNILRAEYHMIKATMFPFLYKFLFVRFMYSLKTSRNEDL